MILLLIVHSNIKENRILELNTKLKVENNNCLQQILISSQPNIILNIKERNL